LERIRERLGTSAKVGLDGHDRGIKVVAQALRMQGWKWFIRIASDSQQVSYGLQENVDILGLSFPEPR
jgi:methylmalonyl-CoA mutase cobalamin-binding domain/chain